LKRLLVAQLAIAIWSVGTEAQVRERDCGFERWSVKVLRDPDAKRIRKEVVPVTVTELTQIPIPQIAYPLNGRITPQELTIYRLQGVVDEIIVQDDRDWHIVLRDPHDPAVSIIVEIPDPDCVDDLSARALIVEARRSLHLVPRKGIAEFEGVGFFDFIHTQRGRAKNGFELHPVLAIRLIPKV
jgi:hypothetical protein